MRKVIFTESQIKRLINEDPLGVGGAYLPKKGAPDAEIGASKITTTDGREAKENGSGPILDKLAKWETPYTGFGSMKGKCASVRTLEEQNSNLEDSKIVVPDWIKNQLSNGKRTNNIKKNGEMEVNTADKMVFDTNDSDNEGDIALNHFLKHQLSAKRGMDKAIRRTKPENGFIKNHKKTKVGTAHTKKDNLPTTITYDNSVNIYK